MSRGIMSNSCGVTPPTLFSIQWPDTTITRATPASLGTNVSVTSWIWVTDWNREMASPMARLVMRMGAATLATTSIICTAISMTAVSVMSASVEAREQGLDDQRPSVDQHEQQDLEGEGDEDRREHHHSHGHERRAHDEVEHQERDADDEADAEGRL